MVRPKALFPRGIQSILIYAGTPLALPAAGAVRGSHLHRAHILWTVEKVAVRNLKTRLLYT